MIGIIDHPRRLSQLLPDTTLIGDSPVMQTLKRSIARMGPADLPVLITGETGTGKELIARCLHASSPRAQGPFIAVNCPAVPQDLFQAELFGYEKGAFTGADRRNTARIDAAHGGTLFLDEIGDMPQGVQAVLLRFLQEGTFERLGSVQPIRADVRVLAATHQNLPKAIADGRFREDLFYRLNTLHLHAPALRDRAQDAVALADFFLQECCRQLGLTPSFFAADAKLQIMSHGWPGNVRELRNRIMQALVLCESPELRSVDLELDNVPAAVSIRDQQPRTLEDHRHQAEKEAIQLALLSSGGCVPQAAALLGISRAQLYRLVKQLSIAVKPSHRRIP